jgi:hypothetical protein
MHHNANLIIITTQESAHFFSSMDINIPNLLVPLAAEIFFCMIAHPAPMIQAGNMILLHNRP